MHFYYLIYILICIIMKYQCFIMVKEVQNVYIYIYICVKRKIINFCLFEDSDNVKFSSQKIYKILKLLNRVYYY